MRMWRVWRCGGVRMWMVLGCEVVRVWRVCVNSGVKQACTITAELHYNCT